MKMHHKYLCTLSMVLLGISLIAPTARPQAWTSDGPLPRARQSAVLDPNSNRTIIFGGGFAAPYIGSPTLLNDVWVHHGTDWTALTPTGDVPAQRQGHSAVYDPNSNTMIVFGGGEGNTSPCSNEVWTLTNANNEGGTPAWVQLFPAGSGPAPRMLHGAVYDATTNSMIVFGGEDCFSTLFNDVWVLSNANGLTGTPAWTQLSPSGTAPSPREVFGSVTYDAVENHLIVFGGFFNPGLGNDVWVLSSANGLGGTPTWTQLSPTGALPPARTENCSVYDQAKNRLVIFGGETATDLLGDVWVLTHANGEGGTSVWTETSAPQPFPGARADHSCVYNQASNTMTVFGGFISNFAATVSDVWELKAASKTP